MEVAFQAEAEDSNMGMRLVRIRSRKEARVWGGGACQCHWGIRCTRSVQVIVRTWASTLKEMRGHQMYLSRGLPVAEIEEHSGC